MTTTRRLTQGQLRDLEDELRTERARLERSIAMRKEADDASPTMVNSFRDGTQAKGGLAVASHAAPAREAAIQHHGRTDLNS